jgi:hypothetical protein
MKARLFVISTVLVLAAVPGWSADFDVSNFGFTAYTINTVNNPVLTLVRGQTYTFAINAPGHPFWIKTAQVTGTGSAFNTGVANNGITSGTLTFVVPETAPNTLFYACQIHAAMSNQIHITNPTAITPSTWSGIKALFGV